MKVLDMFTYISLELSMSGFEIDGEGKVNITIKPRLITEYPQDTVWQQNLMYEMMRRFWHKFYYHHKRMEYLNLGKELVTTFESSIKHFGETLNK